MHPYSFLGQELTQLPSGRIFCRTNGGTGFIGLVEMPAFIATESLRQFRLNDHIWVDAQNSRVASARHSRNPDEPSYFGTHAASNLLTDLEFGQSILHDGLECFVRKSFLPHDNPEMSWNIVVSAKRNHLPAMPKDGLYEIQRRRLQAHQRTSLQRQQHWPSLQRTHLGPRRTVRVEFDHGNRSLQTMDWA